MNRPGGVLPSSGSVLMEYCLVNLFIGCVLVLVWRNVFYNDTEGWRDAGQDDALAAQQAVGGDTEAVDLRGSSGAKIADAYRRVLNGIAMPFP
ncbi:MAG: hypothetical protein FWF96_03235 [Kiritimatiellaeota bacterium]|nr:hypothetical protein [Kiritimatiellota bacterium]